MKEAWEDVKKTNFGLDFGLFTPNLSRQKFFATFNFTSS